MITTQPSWLGRFDSAGSVLSTLCALHCLFMPLLIGMLPLLGMEFLADEQTEYWMFAVALGVACVSAALGYRCHHKLWLLAMFTLSVASIVLGRVVGEESLFARVLLIGGALALAVCHLINRRQCRLCETAASTRLHGSSI